MKINEVIHHYGGDRSSNNDTNILLQRLDEVINELQKFKNYPLIWRGFNTGNVGDSIFKVISSDRDDYVFKGNIYTGVIDLLKALGIKKPIFTSYDVNDAVGFFGNGTPYVFIPIGDKFKCKYNINVDDVVGIYKTKFANAKGSISINEKNNKSFVKSLYDGYQDGLPPSGTNVEIIFYDCDSYFLIDIIRMQQYVNNNFGFLKDKRKFYADTRKSLNNYSDLINLMQSAKNKQTQS